MARELEGKVALVTGSSGGIGRATAIMLAAMGVDLVLLDLRGDALAEVALEIEATGRRAHAITIDIQERAGVRAAIAEAEAVLGGVGILANNAGVGASGPGELENIGDADLDRMFGVHVMGAFVGAEAVMAAMGPHR